MMMFNNKMVLAVLILMTAACTTTKLPPINYYTINIPASDNKKVHSLHEQQVLRVAMPRSTAAIMSRNILYQGDGYSLNAYAFSKWSDTPNRMLASLFLNVIEDKSVFKAVLPADSRGNSNYVLESSIQQFHQQIAADTTSRASIRIGFYLIEARSGKVIATREFVSTHKANSTDASGAVRALNLGSVDISSGLIEWLSSQKLD